MKFKKFTTSFFVCSIFISGLSSIAHSQEQPSHFYYATIANEFYLNFKYDTAALYYDSALNEAIKDRDKLHTAYYLNKKARNLRAYWNNDSAKVLLLKSLKLIQEIGNDTIEALNEVELGWVYTNKGIYDSAVLRFKNAISIYESLNDTLGKGHVNYFLSELYQTYTDLEQALKYGLESNRVFTLADDKEYMARSLLNLGNIYEVLKEYDTAYACYEACYLLASEINMPKTASKAAFNLGVIYLHKSENKKAEEAFLKAIKFNKQIDNYNSLSLSYRNLSITQKRLEEFDQSFDAAKKSLFYARLVDNPEYEFYSLINIGLFYKNVFKIYDSSEVYYLKALEITKIHDLKKGKKMIYNNLSLLYKTMGDFKNALKYREEYVDINDTLVSIEKTRAVEKYRTEYEVLHYKDQSHIKELEKKKIRFERNLSFGLGITAIILLALILFLYRMRARKNRIIAAQKIQKLEDEKKLMAAQSVMVGEEKERERIARELHDGIGVLLSTASIHFSSVEEKADKETSEMLNKANKLLRDASKEVRQISHNMMPGVLSKFGLREAIEDLCEDLEEVSHIKIDLSLTCGKTRLSENMEIMIYRVIQEMLNNTIKHAEATKISLSIVRNVNNITIDYRDDGKGFDEEQLPHGKNLGLSGIRSRVEYLGGHVVLSSEPGKGTVYSISIPIKV